MRKNLKNERENAQLVQADVAKMLAISTRQYQALEAGTSDGSIKVWEKLRKLFNRPIDYLLEQESIEKSSAAIGRISNYHP